MIKKSKTQVFRWKYNLSTLISEVVIYASVLCQTKRNKTQFV